MTLAAVRPRGPTPARTARRRRLRIDRGPAPSINAVEVGRITVCCGCHMIGWYPDDALAQVLADLARWALDPSARDALPWPVRCDSWDWLPGETLAVWHAGRVLALVTKPVAGDVVIRRDPAAAAE